MTAIAGPPLARSMPGERQYRQYNRRPSQERQDKYDKSGGAGGHALPVGLMRKQLGVLYAVGPILRHDPVLKPEQMKPKKN